MLIWSVCLALGLMKGCHCEFEAAYNPEEGDPGETDTTDNPNTDNNLEGEECLELKELLTTEIMPAGIRSVFQLFDCNGDPIPNLANNELRILLDGNEVISEGDIAPVVTQAVNVAQYSLLLLDLSNSIVDNGHLLPMIKAARQAVHALASAGQQVAIYKFAGPKYFEEVQDFTGDVTLLDQALDQLALSQGLGTTDLYGSIIKAVDILGMTGSADVLSTHTLVLFTDGTDEAMVTTKEAAQNAVDKPFVDVFTVGLGGDVNKEELTDFGKSGFEWSANAQNLIAAFDAITKKIQALSRSQYLVAVCSPRVDGQRDMTIQVQRAFTWGELTVYYNADGFDIVGCDANAVAFPCYDKDCGKIEGILCGECAGTAFCNEDYLCQEACTEEVQCGNVFGIDCGDCAAFGETFACDDANTCVDACADAQCGTILGVNCGDCSAFGETFGCDENNTCVDACADAQCGTILGVDCGDCSAFGETFGCDENNACVDACADAQCGTILGVDCGDCSAFGETFGCDENNTCVEACAQAACGISLGVDCGECAVDFECNNDNMCEPEAMGGLTWRFVPGGEVTLGCEAGVDAACDFDDENRRQVSLSDFWIMDSEVTVEMYTTCVAGGGCNHNHVNTTELCNYGLPGRSDHPINCIDWQGLEQFCKFLGGDLPTESQWERAYRGNHDGVLDTYWVFPWGNAPAPTCDRVVMYDGDLGCGQGYTQEVRTLGATSFDLYNMGGNVAEWVHDYYSETFEECGGDPCVDPTGPETGDRRVVRGGSLSDLYESAFRTAKRDKKAPSTRSPEIGGRCVHYPQHLGM